ncbi:MAG: hypothetical protein WC292_01110 [Clostridia bacterium]
MKRKLIISILLLVFSTVSLVAVVWGWFTEGSTFRDFIITTGNVESEVTLYYLEDFDNDGSLDIVNDAVVAREITQLNIENIKPGDVYQYRLDIKNSGTLAGDLLVYFDFEDIEVGEKHYSQVLTIESRVYDEDGNIIDSTGVAQMGMEKGVSFATVENIPPARNFNPQPSLQVSVFFTIKFEMLDYLKIASPDMFGSLENLNDYKNLDLETLSITVQLTQHIEPSEPPSEP